MIHHQRLMPVGEVAIGEAVHEPVCERVELLLGTGLGDACAPTASGTERADRQSHGSGQCGVSSVHEVDVELVQIEGVRAVVKEEIGRAAWRRDGAVEVRRQETIYAATFLEADLRGWVSLQHRRSIQRAYSGTCEGIAAEHVEGDIVGVRPYT